MKKTICIFLLVISKIVCSQFTFCNSPTTENLNDVYFINENIGLIVGENGTILKSIDGGINWSNIINTEQTNFIKIAFFDSLNGIAISYDKIFITNDQGETWQEISYDAETIYDIAIINENDCIISCSPQSLIKSTNKGVSFFNLNTEPNKNYNKISFVSADIGFACEECHGGPTTTLKTIDGGQNWTFQSIEGNTIIEGFKFFDENIGFKAGWYNPHFKKTINAGENWNSTQFPTSGNFSLNDFFISQDLLNSFYACGWNNDIYKSNDQGENWIQIPLENNSNNYHFYGIYFISENLGWVVGSNGVILRTENGSELGIVDLNKYSNEIDLYPNPVKNIINIKYDNFLSDSNIKIYNSEGKLIDTLKIKREINLNFLSTGEYIFVISNSEFRKSFKVIKE